MGYVFALHDSNVIFFLATNSNWLCYGMCKTRHYRHCTCIFSLFSISAALGAGCIEDGPNRYASPPDGDFPSNPFSRLVIGVFIVVGASMLLINVFLIACFLKRRSKKRMTSGEKSE